MDHKPFYDLSNGFHLSICQKFRSLKSWGQNQDHQLWFVIPFTGHGYPLYIAPTLSKISPSMRPLYVSYFKLQPNLLNSRPNLETPQFTQVQTSIYNQLLWVNRWFDNIYNKFMFQLNSKIFPSIRAIYQNMSMIRTSIYKPSIALVIPDTRNQICTSLS